MVNVSFTSTAVATAVAYFWLWAAGMLLVGSIEKYQADQAMSEKAFARIITPFKWTK